jgi:hypothetical protein
VRIGGPATQAVDGGTQTLQTIGVGRQGFALDGAGLHGGTQQRFGQWQSERVVAVEFRQPFGQLLQAAIELAVRPAAEGVPQALLIGEGRTSGGLVEREWGTIGFMTKCGVVVLAWDEIE